MKLPKIKKMPISKIKPYANNPRKIPETAVEAVIKSIERYGYVQPIVVDKQGVVIAGHTRLAALTKMGRDEVEVYQVDLPEKMAQKYRLVDNRTHELTDWAHDSLIAELREFEGSELEEFFPNVSLDLQAANIDLVNEQNVLDGANQAERVADRPDVPMTTVECPSCRGEFQVRTLTLPGVSFEDLNWD